MNNIPVYKPYLSGNEKKYVNECIDSSWISSRGKFIDQFEERFAEYVGVKNAVGVCNGTVSLHLAMLALGITEGDEVIVPTLTYIASVNSIKYVNATPVFVDSLKDSWQMDPAQVRAKITPRTKAIMIVHLYGHPCNMDELIKIAKENNLYIIEDCAEAIGSKYKGKHVGSFGDISSFSFYGNKTITTGEGGMILTNNRELHDKCYHLKMQGVDPKRQYWHDIVGYNYKMTNICAAIGLAQLEQIESIVEKKLAIAEKYRKAFLNTEITFHPAIGDVVHSYWMCSILVNNPQKRDGLRNSLQEKGIETRPLFFPVHTMPMYFEDIAYPVSENISLRGMNLPSYPDLKQEQIELISDIIIQYCN